MLYILFSQRSLPLTPPQLRCYAVRFASRIAFGSSGKKAAFTTLNGFTAFGSRFLCKSSRFHQPGVYGTSGESSLFSSSPMTSRSPDENTGSGNPDRHWPGFPDDLCFLLLNLFLNRPITYTGLTLLIPMSFHSSYFYYSINPSLK